MIQELEESKYKEEGIKFEKCNQLLKSYLVTSNQYKPFLQCPISFIDFPYTLVLSELQRYLKKLEEEKRSLPLLFDVDPHEGSILNRWKIGHLRIYGKDTELGKSAHFKETMNFIQARCQEYNEYVPTIMISLLEPGVELEPHHGYYCGVMRYHLPLVVPRNQESEQECFIMIDGIKHQWKIGQEPLCFDDTFLHSAHNKTKEPRYILLMDILRKFPSSSKNQLNRILVDDATKSLHVKNMIEKCNSIL